MKGLILSTILIAILLSAQIGYAALHSRIIKLVIVLTVLLLTFAQAGTLVSGSDQFYLRVPIGIPADLWSYFIPKDNALTPAKVELGRQLFFDARLSADGSVSCGTCHDPSRAFTDGRKTAVGIANRKGVRNTPTILNAMFNSTMFWDGRADSLEAQAIQPLVNPDEMGNSSHEQVVNRIAALPEYAAQFQHVFGKAVTIDLLAKAIAAYERTLVSGNAPFDRSVAGDRNAMSESAQRGFNLFRTKARCTVCHNLNTSFPFLTDGNYRNTGVAANFSGFDALSRLATTPTANPAGASESINHGAGARTALEKQKGAAELGR
ncbi:MAG TPA: cytochrome-c peroxidase, partial [Pyrinomonadaceae bacterium]|nr:cytochrome-c peroxidase [Pyrinomonadaceae bacterium]